MRLPATGAAVLAALLLAGALVNPAQAADGSRYLTLDHWSYEGIHLLQEAGYLPALNPLVQPYRRADIARELRAVDPALLPAGLAHWARLLKEEFAGEDTLGPDTVAWGAWIEGGARASTSKRLDPLRPLGDDGDAWPYARGSVWVDEGPVAAEVVLLEDRFLADDPDGRDPQRRIGRSETAYLSLAFPHGEFMVGRLARNWSRAGTRGLMVGDAATPYPQVGLTFRAGRFTLRSFVGELDTLRTYKRYVSAHRIDVAWPNLVLSLGEGVVFASERPGLALRYLNPVEVFYSDTDALPDDHVANLMIDLGFWWRSGRFEAYGEGLLDDVDVTPPEGADREPTGYALTLGGRWNFSDAGHAAGLEYTRVGAWTYRTPNEVDRTSYLGRGLGENYSDFDRLTVSADLLAPLPGLRLTPTVQLQRQGEGNFRDPVPAGPQYTASPNLFLGTRERTVRVGLRGRYQPRGMCWVGWDAGANFTTNRDHIAGADDTSFSAVAELGLRLNAKSDRNAMSKATIR